MRLLLVDDDAGFRSLLRATFEVLDIDVEEAENSAEALSAIRGRAPDVVVLDVQMPGQSGLELCRALKDDPRPREIGIVLLTGSEGGSSSAAIEAGADAFLLKPFSPLELLAIVERLAGGLNAMPFRSQKARGDEEQLLLYARDLRHLLEIERGQRLLLESAYHDTVAALASALESKDTGTGAHSQRVQRYALELERTLGASSAGERGIEYGYLLHDVGKIGIPDQILQKPGPLTPAERRLMQTHTVLGEQMLGGVAFFEGEALRVVRSHHERWDGKGYPDGIAGEEIPLCARIFAVADTLDAMTSDRPYRAALDWSMAEQEITELAGKQFDPDVVDAFRTSSPRLQDVRAEFATA
ncbi:MAG: response regulator [Actinomycetota bacterium]|nr:response regulator [Actinomycetota bacterium]